MKLSSVVIAASLAANAGMLAAFFLVPSDSSSSSTALSSTSAPASPSAITSAATAASTTPANAWARLSTENLPSLIARLRAAGVPTSVLHALIYQRFESRLKASRDDVNRPYWKKAPETPPDPKAEAERAKLEREYADTVKQLLGSDAEPGSNGDESREMRFRQYGNLSAEKISQVQAVSQAYGERLTQIYNSARGGTLGPEFAEKIDAVNREGHAEIAKLLTPDELLEYDLRNSQTSARLRMSLTGLNPTEAEYRALFPLYQAYDAQFPPIYSSIKPEVMAARTAAQQQMQEQIKALLPPDRYADYLQASNPQYQQLNQLVARLELPLSAAAQVASVQQEIQSRANALRTDRQLAPADRTAQLAALAAEAQAKITAAIGARGLEGYKQYGGQWLNQLTPAPRPNAKN